MEVRVAIPRGTKGRQLAVTLTNTRLGVALKGAKTPGEVRRGREAAAAVGVS